MHPTEFCEYYLRASLFLIFLSNSTLALLLGIPYSEQRRDRVLDPNRLVFGRGEVVQIITSSMTMVLLFCLFLCGTSVIPCCRFKVSKIVAFVTLAALSMVGTCCLTIYGGENGYCQFDRIKYSKTCYRRPDVDLPLTWLSTVVALTGIIASFALHLYDDAAHTWPRKDGGRPGPIRRDSLELVNMERSSNGNNITEFQDEAPTYGPPPTYESSVTPLSSHVIPSVPMRREMNKLGLTVITDIPMLPSELRPLEAEPGRW